MTANSSSPTDVTPLRPGDRFDKYVITQQIGAGGMSIVWKAHDSLLDKFVAIKQMTATGGDREIMKERFAREVEIQKKVSHQHQHLVQVLDMIDSARGLFIIMEFVDGQSLEQILAADPEPFDERRALGIVGAVALALEAIHKNGVIHRDLKPSNILIPKTGGLKVADFGLAVLVDQQETMSVGSVRYMAPELFGESPADGRADIYALGLISYEMLAGRSKFDDAFKIVLRDQRNQALRWMKWHTNTRAKAPALSQLNPGISSKLSDLVSRMMEKDPALRVPSATELLAAIRRHFAGESTETPVAPAGATDAPVPSSEKTAPLPKRNNLPLILAGILLAQVVIGGTIWYMVNSHKEAMAIQAKSDEARNEFLTYHDQYTDAVALSKTLRLAKVPSDEDAQKMTTLFANSKVGFDKLSKEWPPDSVMGKTSLARAALCDAYIELESAQFDKALAAVEKADATGALKDNRDMLQNLRREINQRSAFEQVMDRISQMLQGSQFPQARQAIAELRKHELAPSEASRIEELAARIEDQAQQGRITRILQKADQILASGDRDGAITALSDAMKDYRSPSIEKRLSELVEMRNYDRAFAEAVKIEGQNNTQKAIEAYGRVLVLRPNDAKIELKIKELKSQDSLSKARQALQAGNTEEAQRYFTESLIVENAEARKALGQIESSGQKAGFIKAGDDALAQGDNDAAILQYQNALKLGEDPSIDQKIRDIRFTMTIKRARDYLGSNDLAKATELAKAADKLKPGDNEVTRVLDGIKRRGDYQKLMDDGDKARAASRFVDAKVAYRKAIDIAGNIKSASDVAKRRLDDTEYDQLIAQAKSYIESRTWASARATLITASRAKDSSEIKELMAIVDQADPPKPKPTNNNDPNVNVPN